MRGIGEMLIWKRSCRFSHICPVIQSATVIHHISSNMICILNLSKQNIVSTLFFPFYFYAQVQFYFLLMIVKHRMLKEIKRS